MTGMLMLTSLYERQVLQQESGVISMEWHLFWTWRGWQWMCAFILKNMVLDTRRLDFAISNWFDIAFAQEIIDFFWSLFDRQKILRVGFKCSLLCVLFIICYRIISRVHKFCYHSFFSNNRRWIYNKAVKLEIHFLSQDP